MINTFFAYIKNIELIVKNFTKIIKSLKFNILREINKKELRRIIHYNSLSRVFSFKLYLFLTSKSSSITIVSLTIYVYINTINKSRIILI